MKPRITVSLSADGSLEISLNETGRDLLVEQLQSLSEENDHLHFGQTEFDDVQVSSRPYLPSDTIFVYGKILFRPDHWDKQHFPHVLRPPRPPCIVMAGSG